MNDILQGQRVKWDTDSNGMCKLLAKQMSVDLDEDADSADDNCQNGGLHPWARLIPWCFKESN